MAETDRKATKPRKRGRPKGSKNKVTKRIGKTLSSLAREYAIEAVETIVTVMQDPATAPRAKITAANILLDRGFGKPAQRLELDDKPPELADALRLVQPGDPDFEDLNITEQKEE